MDKVAVIAFLIQFVVVLGNLLTYAIIGRVIVSWMRMGKAGPPGRFSQVIIDVTNPIISLVRRLPHKIGMFDLSPIIALLAIELLSAGIIALLTSLV
ncbi:MAG: YggT family protein [Candidatus Peregrinibacteria bacterium]